MMSLNPRQFTQLQLPGTDVPEAGPRDRGYPLVADDGMPFHRLAKAHQQRMLMPMSEVIDTVHKIDSSTMEEGATPREQWDDIRQYKASPKLAMAVRRSSTLPPIRVQMHDDYEPELWDGHHRLRELEDAGHTEVPVWESWNEREHGYEVAVREDEPTRFAGGGWTGKPNWHRTPKGTTASNSMSWNRP
jgi:hypothetical protein